METLGRPVGIDGFDAPTYAHHLHQILNREPVEDEFLLAHLLSLLQVLPEPIPSVH